jgi:simple sugar transport system ATP-binding protein
MKSPSAEKGRIILEMQNISKRFPGVIANDRISFTLRAGEIHCILGENGAGKTTLMNILFGLYAKDGGDILVDGRRVSIESPRDALTLGIGMIHQTSTLVPGLSALENIVLGSEPSRGPRWVKGRRWRCSEPSIEGRESSSWMSPPRC